MRFRYQRLRFPDGSLDEPRPFLPVTVEGPRKRANMLMLVDSGAGDTILARQFLELLGVTFSGEKVAVGSFDYRTREADVGAVRLRFGGGRFDLVTRVLAFPGRCMPVLGQRVFFERFFVGFNASKGIFVVDEPRP